MNLDGREAEVTGIQLIPPLVLLKRPAAGMRPPREPEWESLPVPAATSLHKQRKLKIKLPSPTRGSEGSSSSSKFSFTRLPLFQVGSRVARDYAFEPELTFWLSAS